MWFKQIQLFRIGEASFDQETLTEKLQQIEFTPCLPSMPQSIGWAATVDEDEAPLVRTVNGYFMFCMQVEDKILPATVIRQELNEAIKQIEASESRKLRGKEKMALKDDIMMTLLPRAFKKSTRVYAYIDTKNNWLVLGTTNSKMTDQFMSLYKKTISDDIFPVEMKNLSATMTSWLKNKNNPTVLNVEKACVLQDPKQENRVIRCQHQDLFATSIQGLIKDGCEAIQLKLTWHDRVNFVLVNDGTIRSINYQDEIKDQAKELEPETRQQQLDADFLIMSETLSRLSLDVLEAINHAAENVVAMDKAS